MSRQVLSALTAGLGLLAGTALVGWALWLPPAPVPVVPGPIAIPVPPAATAAFPNREDLVRQARERALPLLAQADQEARQAVDEQIRALDTYFDDAKARTPALAESVLGLASEWRLVADQIPYAGGGRHEAFLRQEFDRLLFPPEELDRRMQAAVRSYLQAERAVEDRLLVRLRQDIDDIPAVLPEAGMNLDRIRAVLDQAMAETMARAQINLKADVAREIVVLGAAEILTRLAIRTALPASLAGSGPWTFGVGLAAAVAADQAMAWTWDRWADPRGQLVEVLKMRLDELQRRVVDGTPEQPGLRKRLEELARQRGDKRHAVVLQAIESIGGDP